MTEEAGEGGGGGGWRKGELLENAKLHITTLKNINVKRITSQYNFRRTREVYNILL